MVLLFVLGARSIVHAATPADVTLGQASDYSLLAGSALTKGDTSTIAGDMTSTAGIFPGTVAPDVAASFVTTGAGSFENGTAPAGLAQTDLGVAISSIAALTPTRESPLFSNETLTPGVYAAPSGTALAITVGLVLDGGGDPNARFIFRSDSALNIDASIVIHLLNGAQERNVFWMVGSAVTIGANADVPGNLLVVSAATLGANAIIRGSLLCEGAVTIGANSSINFDHVTVSTPTPTPTPVPAPVERPTPSPSPSFIPIPLPSPSPIVTATPAPIPSVTPSAPAPTPTLEPTPLPSPFVTPSPPNIVPTQLPVVIPSSKIVAKPKPSPSFAPPQINTAVATGPITSTLPILSISPPSISGGVGNQIIHIVLQNLAIGDQVLVVINKAAHG